MLLVIIGAGASFDALSNRASNDARFGKLVERLPLANELFEDRPLFRTWMKQFGRCLPVIPYLQNNPNVESALEKLQSEGATNTERLHQLAAIRFYLQAMIWKCELGNL